MRRKKEIFASDRLNWFLPDGFGFIRNMKLTPPENYADYIDLSIGAPNRATPKEIIDRFVQDVYVEKYHTYPPQFGAPELCGAVAKWYKRRFSVSVNPNAEVLVTIGIKEAIFNTMHALVNPGETVIIPDPGYPTYFEAGGFCGAKLVTYNSNTEQECVLEEIKNLSKLYDPSYVMVNYPSNPTGRLVSDNFYTKLSALSREYNFVVLSDLAYSEIAFDNQKAGSYLFGNGGTRMALEYFAFSKTYNMAGWRVGAIVAEHDILEAIKLYKSKIDSNVFYPIQLAAAFALENVEDAFYRELAAMYQERRNILCDGLKAAGLSFTQPGGAMYAWVKAPDGWDTWAFTQHMYDTYGIVGVPGNAYGRNGIGYIRLGLVQEAEIMTIAADRLKKDGWV
ncbi:MAG: aminotransferase class I/II-fold pyridoxal phosphate-dependent enzyme [Treponema sp.]|jgi:LL-diaminopimelate aminotransferase|nr:aminotransferase class I/II-fold pyridoxal phosphate-dependent enzyme [Treponema sp.]